jgi:hypothetical protein
MSCSSKHSMYACLLSHGITPRGDFDPYADYDPLADFDTIGDLDQSRGLCSDPRVDPYGSSHFGPPVVPDFDLVVFLQAFPRRDLRTKRYQIRLPS